MELLSKIDKQKIEDRKLKNDKLEDLLAQKRKLWASNLAPIFKTISTNLTSNQAKDIIEAQTSALSYRQELLEEITSNLIKRNKLDNLLKGLVAEKMIFYSTGFGYKPSSVNEKKMLIDNAVSEWETAVKLYEIYIDFLRETVKNLESFQYSVKNVIAFLEYIQK